MRKIFLASIMVLIVSGIAAGIFHSEAAPQNPDESSIEGSNISVIKLKSGGQIEGIIKTENESGVVVDLGFGIVAISREDIKKIELPSGDKKSEVTRKWKEHVSAVEHAPQKRERYRKEFDERIKENLRIKEEMAKRDTEIKYSDEDRITVRALINGKVNANLVVDTGAPMTSITPRIARALPDIKKIKTKAFKMQWVDGSAARAIPVMLDSVEVSGTEVQDVMAVIVEMPPFTETEVDGLLGMTFLKKFHVRIDTEERKLILEDK